MAHSVSSSKLPTFYKFPSLEESDPIEDDSHTPEIGHDSPEKLSDARARLFQRSIDNGLLTHLHKDLTDLVEGYSDIFRIKL